MELRDITYYANDTDIELALVNLDWYKAFDLVSMEFTLKALHKLGFGDRFIHWISILYNNIESSVLINNILGDFFPVSRSVRHTRPFGQKRKKMRPTFLRLPMLKEDQGATF